MSSNLKTPAGTILLYGGFTDVKKINVSQNPRQFPTGSALWLNKVSGRYQAEPALLSPTNATQDSAASNSDASTYTTLALANAAFAPLFLGIAAAARIPAQENTFGLFGVPGNFPNNAMDASKPYLEYYDEGLAEFPVGPTLSSTGVLAAAVEVDTLVQMDGFANEEGTGFYDPAGKLQVADTDYYLYNNCVTTTATAANAIGIVIERGEIGDTVLKVKFKSSVFSQRLGGV